MVWKHSYNQIDKSQLSKMHTHSQVFMPCVNMSVGWCNVPNKQPTGYREQMMAAYHKGVLVYAYKAPLNPKLGKSKTGPYLNVTNQIVDRCTQKRGTRPSLYFDSWNDEMLFDKYSPRFYTSNSDTMHGGYASDARWEDCRLPLSVSARRQHTQMTMVIYVRWNLPWRCKQIPLLPKSSDVNALNFLHHSFIIFLHPQFLSFWIKVFLKTFSLWPSINFIKRFPF